MLDLEDITLLALNDADQTNGIWLDRWVASYPTVITASHSRHDSIEHWQAQMNRLLSQNAHDKLMVVAYGASVWAFLAWLYQAGITEQRRIQAALLVSPPQAAWQDDAVHTLQRARANFRTVIVTGRDDALCPEAWAQALAHQMGAKHLTAPQSGHLDQPLHGWQWGMKLMQELLLY